MKKEYISKPEFQPEFLLSKSQAAQGIAIFLINMEIYYIKIKEITPLREKLEKASEELKQVEEDLQVKMDKLQKIQNQVEELTNKLNTSVLKA